MKKLYTLLLMGLTGFGLSAQNPAGNNINISYPQFLQDNVLRYIRVPHDASLNFTTEMTIEVWTRPFDTSWNQKIVGKTNVSFNTGYMLAVDQGRVYPEVWNPTLNTFHEGFLPPLRIWNHMAFTFAAGGEMIGYVNGINVGSVNVPAGNIPSNFDDLILFISSWGNNDSFMCFGEYDEVRIWDRALSEEEIIEHLHKHLEGTENGLVAYYDFNETTGTTVTDGSGNGNDGTFAGGMGVDNRGASWAVIGDAISDQQNDVVGLWNGATLTDPRFVSTVNGMSLTASNMGDTNYVVFGHDNGSGTTTADLPSGAPTNFERTGRIWYQTVMGDVTADVAMNLSNAAGGGTELDGTQNTVNYTLLWRPDASSNFTSLGSADLFSNGVALFEDVELATGYFAVGVGDDPFLSTAAPFAVTSRMDVFPNPSDGPLTIRLHDVGAGTVSVYNTVGALVWQQQVTQAANRAISIQPEETLPNGMYMVTFTGTKGQLTQTVLIQR